MGELEANENKVVQTQKGESNESPKQGELATKNRGAMVKMHKVADIK